MKRTSKYVPERGDVVFLNFNPQLGHEQKGHRPALVLSLKAYNQKVGLALMCPITSRSKGYPFEVPLPEEFEISGVVLSDQIKSLDWRERKATFCQRVTSNVVAHTIARIQTLLQ